MSLAVEEAGDGSAGAPPLVLAHGLTATRRYVVHGSRCLERAGHRVVSYDARGHGESDPAPDRARTSTRTWSLTSEAVLDERELERVVLVGASMGAATTLAFTLAHPERVAALVQITPAHLGLPQTDPDELARWDALADGLERDGVEGFMRAYGEPPVEPRFRGLIVEAIRQRIERHRHPRGGGRCAARGAALDGVRRRGGARAGVRPRR